MKQWQLYGYCTSRRWVLGVQRFWKAYKAVKKHPKLQLLRDCTFDNNRDEEGDSVNDNRKRTNSKENDSSGAKQQERVEW